MPTSLKDWIAIVSIAGGLFYGVGAWAGRYNERVEMLMNEQKAQMTSLQNTVYSQSVSIAVMQEQIGNLRAQVDGVSKAVGAPIVR